MNKLILCEMKQNLCGEKQMKMQKCDAYSAMKLDHFRSLLGKFQDYVVAY